MQAFNMIFTPFGFILVIFALVFSQPQPKDTFLSIITLLIQFAINHYMFKNIYHFSKPHILRKMLVIFNILTTSIVFYSLQSYWAPVWLLYTMPPIFASTFLNQAQTIIFSLISALSMIFMYYLKATVLEIEISSTVMTMAMCHAFFIVAVSVFVNIISQAIVKMRKI